MFPVKKFLKNAYLCIYEKQEGTFNEWVDVSGDYTRIFGKQMCLVKVICVFFKNKYMILKKCVDIIKKCSCFLKVGLFFEVSSCASENQAYAFEKQPLILNSSMKK